MRSRSSVNFTIDDLKKIAGICRKNKIKSYSITNPSKFLDMASAELTNAEEKQKVAKKIIEDIKLIKQENKATSLAQIFVGEEGKRAIMDDIINTGSDFLIFGSEGKFEEGDKLYTQQWAERRRKKKIKAKIIATRGSEAPYWELNQIKFVPKENQSPTSTFVYGNKVAMFIQEDPISIILIESEKITKSYRNYFNLLWKIAKT